MEPLRKDVQELVCLFFSDGHAGEMLFEEIPDRLMPALGAGLDQGFFKKSDRAVNVFCATYKAVGESGCCDGPQVKPEERWSRLIPPKIWRSDKYLKSPKTFYRMTRKDGPLVVRGESTKRIQIRMDTLVPYLSAEQLASVAQPTGL